MIDLDKLEALARAATPGPWEVQVDERPHHRGGAHIERRIRTSWEHGQLKAPYPVITTSVGIGAVAGGPAHYMVSLGENDAAHIAATNPTAVLELIALARQAAARDTVAIPLVSGEELLAHTQPLLKWIDDMKGSGPTMDSVIEYIEQLRAAQTVPPTPVTIPDGWRVERCSDGRIAVQKTTVGGYAATRGDDNIASSILHALAADMLAAQPVQQPAPVAEPHYEAGRKQGRAEALAILMQLDPEGGIDEYTGWSTPVGPEDEGAAYWEEEKLRELFGADSALADMMDRAEAEYWKYLGMQDEAERAKNFAANMHSSGKVREVLSKAGEFSLMGQLCSATPVAAPVAANNPEMPDGSNPVEIDRIKTGQDSGRGAALVEYLIRYKHCMSYNDSYFSEPAGELKRMVYAANRAHPANVAQVGELSDAKLIDWLESQDHFHALRWSNTDGNWFGIYDRDRNVRGTGITMRAAILAAAKKGGA